MLARLDRCFLGMALAIFTPSAAVAQLGPDPAFTWSYPFNSCRSVASEGGAGTGVTDLIFSPAGGGLFALSTTDEATPTEPQLWPDTSNNAIRAGGFVYDVRKTDNLVVVANGLGGVRGYDRNPPSPIPPLEEVLKLDKEDFLEIVDVRAIDIVEGVMLEGLPRDLIVFGTNDLDTAGRVFLYDVTTPEDPLELDVLEVGAPVLSIAASKTITSGQMTVLVGLIDGSASFSGQGRGSLLRLDVLLSGEYAAQVTGAADVWGDFVDGSSITRFTVVRDIVIDESGSIPRAYIAGFTRGLFAIDVPAGGGLYEETASPWPLRPLVEEGIAQRSHGVTVIHLPGGEDLLVAAYGPRLKVGLQIWGECSVPAVGDGSEAIPGVEGPGLADEYEGVGVFDLDALDPSGDGWADPEGFIPVMHSNPGTGQLPSGAWAVSIRPESATRFHIDVALDHKGLTVVRADKVSAASWQLLRGGAWDLADELPTSSTDYVLVRNDVVYASNEIALATFDTTVGDPLAAPTEVTPNGGVLLATFPGLNDPQVVYASGQSAGIVFYNITHKLHPTVASGGDGVLYTEGQVLTPIAFTFTGVVPAQYWLIAVNNKDLSERGEEESDNGSVVVWDVGHETAPSGPASTIQQLDKFYVPDSNQTHPARGLYVGGHAVNISPSPTGLPRIAIYLTYGRQNQTEAGLMTLVGEYNTNQDTLSLRFADKDVLTLPGGIDPDTQVGLLTWDDERDLLYGAYGCSGVAMYDITTNPLNPAELGFRHLPTETGFPELAASAAIQVVPGPSNHVLVTLLRRGVATLDATSGTSFSSGPIEGLHFSQFQANGLFPTEPDPGYPATVAAYWMADGRGGVHKVHFFDF